MGTRLEIYCKDKIAAEEIVAISRSFNVDAQIIGRVEAADKSSVEVKSEFGEFTYS
jgi:phosphoribosylformylglycinamidine cyclo-ligase